MIFEKRPPTLQSRKAVFKHDLGLIVHRVKDSDFFSKWGLYPSLCIKVMHMALPFLTYFSMFIVLITVHGSAKVVT
jgi:hypothetical protein